MACEFCAGKFIQQKLGRCKQCMWLNLLLLLVSLSLYLYFDVKNLQAVQYVALVMLVGASSLLMVSHIVAWCFYRFAGNRK